MVGFPWLASLDVMMFIDPKESMPPTLPTAVDAYDWLKSGRGDVLLLC
jgi:hypothetical protein